MFKNTAEHWHFEILQETTTTTKKQFEIAKWFWAQNNGDFEITKFELVKSKSVIWTCEIVEKLFRVDTMDFMQQKKSGEYVFYSCVFQGYGNIGSM